MRRRRSDSRTSGLGSYIREQFADIGGVELNIAPRDEQARAAEFHA